MTMMASPVVVIDQFVRSEELLSGRIPFHREPGTWNRYRFWVFDLCYSAIVFSFLDFDV
jgi:hypothetical protein